MSKTTQQLGRRNTYTKQPKDSKGKFLVGKLKSLNEKCFDKWNEQSAYFLGVLYADGNLMSNQPIIQLGVHYKDIKMLLKFKDFLQTNYAISKSRQMRIIKIRSQKLYNKLLGMGLSPRKSKTLTFPDCIPISETHHFIRGYFDGDGCITSYSTKYRKNKKRVIIIGTKEFLTSISHFIGVPYSLVKRTNNNCYALQYSGQYALCFADYIYKNANIFLKRKQQKFNDAFIIAGSSIQEKNKPQWVRIVTKAGEVINTNIKNVEVLKYGKGIQWE